MNQNKLDHEGIKWDQMEQNGTKWIKWKIKPNGTK